MATKSGQNYINHITLILDASGSMDHLKSKVVKVTDELVAFLAEKSKKDNEETRLTVYSFAEDVICHVWDMDVFRFPSISGLYKIRGMTAMADALHVALDDIALVPEKYGDHDQFVYLLGDGLENASRGRSGHRVAFGRIPADVLQKEMRERIGELPQNRTLLALAPDDNAARHMYNFGFSPGNVALWDATTEQGLVEAVEKIKTAHTAYVATRSATGVRGTKTAFTVGANVDAKAIKDAKLVPVPAKDRKIVVVVPTDDSFEKVVKPANSRRSKPEMGWFVKIEDYVKRVNKGVYPLGDAFYELVKTEQIAGDKEIAVIEVNTNKVFVGDGARHLLKLPEEKRTVKPDFNPDYKIFVQSNSLNRHLPHGCQVMVLNR